MSIANAVSNNVKISTINIENKLFKELKKINEMKQEHVFYIFIVSSYFDGKQFRSIRRFQRKLGPFDGKLNIFFCVISLQNAQKESKKMFNTLAHERKASAFYKDNVIVYNDDQQVLNDMLSSIAQYINKNPATKITQRVKEKQKDKERESSQAYDFTICYGTMSGNSKEICMEIVSMALARHNGYSINGPIALNKMNLMKLFGANYGYYLIIVISTTGDGELPCNADAFYRKLKLKSRQMKDAQGVTHIAKINYAILGLGDSNYSQFNAAAKKLDTVFSVCGANKFYHTGYADDGVGLEDVVEPWKYGVIREMERKNLKLNRAEVQEETETQITTKECLASVSIPDFVDVDNLIIINQIQFRISKVIAPSECRRSRYELFDNTFSSSSFKAYDASNQFLVELTAAKYLTSFAEYKDSIVIQVTLRLPHGYSYEIGDILCMYPPNPEFMVQSLLKRLKLNGNDVIKITAINELISTNPVPHIPFKKAITIYDIFRFCIDIRSIPKSKLFIKSLATFCAAKADKIKLLELSYAWLKLRKRTYNLLQLLHEYESCYPSLECLLHFLSPLKPRQYSICSAPSCKVDEIDICLRVLKTDIDVADSYFDGICSCFVYSLCCNQAHLLSNDGVSVAEHSFGYRYHSNGTVQIAVYLKLSPTFKPPSNPSSPLIMIGPGTGVAVFRAFLQHRYQHANNTMAICDGAWRGIHMMFDDETEYKLNSLKPSQSKCVLFFGCRHPHKDYLFKNDWHQFLENGVLNHLFIALSRYYDNKVYVQHLLKENSLLISNMILNDNAYVFVCGDASKMAKKK
eukprot:89714_1